MEIPKINFAKNLKRIRKDKGYRTVSSLANKLYDHGICYAQSTIRSWEAGQRQPNLDTVAVLCGFLDVSADELLF